jgi:hypothetical protein
VVYTLPIWHIKGRQQFGRSPGPSARSRRGWAGLYGERAEIDIIHAVNTTWVLCIHDLASPVGLCFVKDVQVVPKLASVSSSTSPSLTPLGIEDQQPRFPWPPISPACYPRSARVLNPPNNTVIALAPPSFSPNRCWAMSAVLAIRCRTVNPL